VAIEAVRNYPDRFAIMGNFALENPDDRKLIHGWRRQPGMMGLRWPLLLEEHQEMAVRRFRSTGCGPRPKGRPAAGDDGRIVPAKIFARSPNAIPICG